MRYLQYLHEVQSSADVGRAVHEEAAASCAKCKYETCNREGGGVGNAVTRLVIVRLRDCPVVDGSLGAEQP